MSLWPILVFDAILVGYIWWQVGKEDERLFGKQG